MAPAPFKLAETVGVGEVEGAVVVGSRVVDGGALVVVGDKVVEGGAVVVGAGLVGVGVGVRVVAQPTRMRLVRTRMDTGSKNHFLVSCFNKSFSPLAIISLRIPIIKDVC